MRRDARQRRAALLDAAAACFAESGYGVPLEVIAERAGVGRGTLYRNFKDRMALALAIFEREVAALEAMVALDQPLRQIMVDVIRQGMRATSLFARLAAEMPPTGADLAAFEALGKRAEAFAAPMVERARRRGDLRDDVTPAQFVLATRMVGGLLYPLHTEAQVAETIDRGLDLVLRGIQP